MRHYRGFDTDSRRWEALEFREGDIVISSPMKAGTTWTQMICALLVFGTPDIPAPLGALSPWLDMQTRPIDEVVGVLEQQTHRRFIKTHTPLDGLPLDPRVTYIGVGRHPLDLVLSAARHSANIDFGVTYAAVVDTIGEEAVVELLAARPVPAQDPGARLRFFLDAAHPAETALTLAGVMAHYRSYFETDARIVTVHYSDLRRDLECEMRRLADALGIVIEADGWAPLVEAAQFDRMKARAATLVPDAGVGMIRDADAFFARGGEGEWRAAVPEPEIARFEERLAALDPAGGVARWAVDGLYC